VHSKATVASRPQAVTATAR